MPMPTDAQRFAGGTWRQDEDARTVAERVADLRAQIESLMDAEIKTEVGKRLRDARIAGGYSQRQAAARAHVEVRTWQAWQQGRGLNEKTVRIAAKAVDAEYDEIMHGPKPAPVDQDRLSAVESELASMKELLVTQNEQLAHQAKDLANQYRMLAKIFRKLTTPEFRAALEEAEEELEEIARSAAAARAAPSDRTATRDRRKSTG